MGSNLGTGSAIFRLNYDGTTASGLTDITSDLFAGSGFSLQNVYSFGEDARGELYILDGVGGAVYKIVPEPATLLLSSLGGLALWVLAARKRSAHSF